MVRKKKSCSVLFGDKIRTGPCWGPWVWDNYEHICLICLLVCLLMSTHF